MENRETVAASPETMTAAKAEAVSLPNATNVVDVVTSTGGYRTVGNAAALLDEIRPLTAVARFLQSWDAPTRQLAFGFGDGSKGVKVHSNGEVHEAMQGVLSTRFTRSTLERWSKQQPVATSEIVARIGQVLRSYVHFPDERYGDLVALWALGTYAYSMFSHYGYLHFYSDRPRSGKTRVLEVLHHLAFEGTVPLNAPTPPVMRDSAAEGRTLQFDTLERWRDKSTESFSAAMDLLDAGFRNGGTVSKMVKTDSGNWRKESFPVFAPYAMAGINRKSLSETALDRAFAIHMQRKPTKVKTRRYDTNKCETECAAIREDAYVWALHNAGALSCMYEGVALDNRMSRLALNDRAADIWRPLFAIAAFGKLERGIVGGLETLAQESAGDPETAEDLRRLTIATALMKLANAQDDKRIVATPTKLTELLNAAGVIQTDDMHALLTEWGFEQKSARNGDDVRRSWVLDAESLGGVVIRMREAMQPVTV